MKIALAVLLATACGSAPPSVISKDVKRAAERKLDGAEQALVDKQGFAIIGGSETPSFHLGYTALFEQHQPVYVTADSVLYAWHSSYDQILQEVEQEHLIPTLSAMLTELRKRLAASTADPETRSDVEVYLGVAQSFLVGGIAAVVGTPERAAIEKIMALGLAEQPAQLPMFGDSKDVDFSMFKPRGHYEQSVEMQRYFRAMSWLGRTEVEVAYKRHAGDEWTVNRRALRGAMLLASLFQGTTRTQWNLIDNTIGAFVGPQEADPKVESTPAWLAPLITR